MRTALFCCCWHSARNADAGLAEEENEELRLFDCESGKNLESETKPELRRLFPELVEVEEALREFPKVPFCPGTCGRVLLVANGGKVLPAPAPAPTTEAEEEEEDDIGFLG